MIAAFIVIPIDTCLADIDGDDDVDSAASDLLGLTQSQWQEAGRIRPASFHRRAINARPITMKETHSMNLRLVFHTIIALACPSPILSASVTEFGNFAFDAWQDAVAHNFITIGFDELGSPQFVTDQYVDLGVIFTTGFNATVGPGCTGFPMDCWGLDGNGDIDLEFSQPIYSIAAHFPGDIQFELYLGDLLVYTSSEFEGNGFDGFGGLISTIPFDRAVINDCCNDPFLDNLYFGPPIPAPGAIALLALHPFAPTRRRRR